MGLHDLRIAGSANRFEITLDGQKVNGVFSATFSAAVDEAPKLTLEMYVGSYEIDVQTLEIKTEEKNDGE